jgi:hypothetical protein
VAGFPLYTDADVHGPLVDALVLRGWNVLRAIDAYPEATKDPVHFARAVDEGRVLVSNDLDQLMAAEQKVGAGESFPGLIYWRKEHQRLMSVGDFVAAFDAIAAQHEPFAVYPILFIKPRR